MCEFLICSTTLSRYSSHWRSVIGFPGESGTTGVVRRGRPVRPSSSEKLRSQSVIMLQLLPCANRTLKQFVLALCESSHVTVHELFMISSIPSHILGKLTGEPRIGGRALSRRGVTNSSHAFVL